jgi:Holliday junction resolvase RusA-like endonuclease
MKDYKSLTILMARQQIKGKHAKPLKRATIKTTLVIPDRRYIMDGDNAIASLKAGIDGLVAASILSDDKDIHVMPVTYKIDKRQAPKTIIHVQPITTQA